MSKQLAEDEARRTNAKVDDAGTWTDEEMDLLAQEDADRLGWEGTGAYQEQEHPEFRKQHLI